MSEDKITYKNRCNTFFVFDYDIVISSFFFIFFFFFQAEDGIRDTSVTGVQTCALPISVAVGNDVEVAALGEYLYGAGQGYNNFVCIFVGTGIGAGIVQNGRMYTGLRSEERRVGKECRSLWSRDD